MWYSNGTRPLVPLLVSGNIIVTESTQLTAAVAPYCFWKSEAFLCSMIFL